MITTFENSKEIYVISCLNGEITKVKDLNKIKNFKNFAAFRTLEDAITAKKKNLRGTHETII